MNRVSAKFEGVVMGASAGAVEALSIILVRLPTSYALPIMVVVHLPPEHKSVLVDLLGQKCEISIREAEDKEPIEAGRVYFAPPNYHLLIESDRRLSLSTEEAVNFSRPSIDVLFESAADAYGPGLIGVVLTGANDDGAAGLRAVYQLGGTALVQRPEESYASAMPQAALKLCPEARAMSLQEIASFLLEVGTSS